MLVRIIPVIMVIVFAVFAIIFTIIKSSYSSQLVSLMNSDCERVSNKIEVWSNECRDTLELIAIQYENGHFVNNENYTSYISGEWFKVQCNVAAAEMSVIDIIRDGFEGRTDEIGSDILANFILALFRRIEFHGGLRG